jgi:hypothetical protein
MTSPPLLSQKLFALLEVALKSNSAESAKASFDVAQMLDSLSQSYQIINELYILSDSQGYLPATQKLKDQEPHHDILEIPVFDVFSNGNSDY